jgi:hypothetical protein
MRAEKMGEEGKGEEDMDMDLMGLDENVCTC